jgi:hypothetical protein
MKKIVFICSILFFVASIYSQTFQIKQITSGDFDVKNPFISQFSFWDFPLVYFELHNNDSSNIALMGYDPYTDTFQEITALTTGNAMRINPYEDFNHGIAFQTNENGNWDIAFRPYEYGDWGPITFLTNSPEDEFNLSPFYEWEAYGPQINYILFQRLDTIFVIEYDESVIAEYPVFVNTPQYHYSDYIGIYCFNSPNNYPREGIHVIALETDSASNRSLVYKYKPLNGQWEEKSFIKENCECRNPSIQFLTFTPYLIFEDSTLNGFRPFSVYDWDYQKEIQPVPDLLSGNISDFKVDRPDLITLNPSPDIELEYFPHSYFVKDEDNLKIRLNKMESGDIVGDTLITVLHNTSRITIGALGMSFDEVFYTIWEDSSAGHIHLFGRRQLYPVGGVSDENGIDGFLLEQNYPNPFNPSTSIQYAIGSRQFVTLKVYDVLGNEIATLVNEEKPAGEYEVEFNSHSVEGRNLPSGVYFYQLIAKGPETSLPAGQAGSGQKNIQTKKMILLK